MPETPTEEGAFPALVEAIETNAEKSGKANTSADAQAYATATKELAEALRIAKKHGFKFK
jgi:hypothetical protein